LPDTALSVDPPPSFKELHGTSKVRKEQNTKAAKIILRPWLFLCGLCVKFCH